MLSDFCFPVFSRAWQIHFPSCSSDLGLGFWSACVLPMYFLVSLSFCNLSTVALPLRYPACYCYTVIYLSSEVCGSLQVMIGIVDSVLSE